MSRVWIFRAAVFLALALAMGRGIRAQQFPHEEELEGERVMHFWDRDINAWKAFSSTKGSFVTVKPEWKARWDETTRATILEILGRSKNDELRKKIGEISPKLSKLAEAAMKAAKPGEMRIVCFEFLAFQRNPADRALIEKLVEPDGWPVELAGKPEEVAKYSLVTRKSADGGLVIEKADDNRVIGDYLLGVFEGKEGMVGKKPQEPTTMPLPQMNGFKYTIAPFGKSLAAHVQEKRPRYYLGEVSGRVWLPMAIQEKAGWLRLVLAPEKLAGKAWEDSQVELIEVELAAAVEEFETWVDAASFTFGTVKPGRYKAKAIWDKRAPFTDKRAAGAGDYESAWSSVIEVGRAAHIADLVLNCTNRVSGGEAYYAVDELIEKKRRDGLLARPVRKPTPTRGGMGPVFGPRYSEGIFIPMKN